MSTFMKEDARIFARYAKKIRRYDLVMYGESNGMEISVNLANHDGEKYHVEVSIPYDERCGGNPYGELYGDHHADTIPAAINGAKRSLRKQIRYRIKQHESTLRKLNSYL